MQGTGHIYLNRPERAAIIRYAHSQLEALRNAVVVAPVELAFWETLLLKLEGHRKGNAVAEIGGTSPWE